MSGWGSPRPTKTATARSGPYQSPPRTPAAHPVRICGGRRSFRRSTPVAGFVAQAFLNGASAHAIMRQTGHTTPGMLEVCAREHAPLIGNAVTHLGL